jgi:choline monooxygenase
MTVQNKPKSQPKFLPSAEHSGTLPSTYYFDPEIFEREKEKIWFKTWQYVGLAADVKDPGDYFTAFVIDQPVFVVRAKSGQLRAFYNVCTHRGHILVEGRGNKKIMTCPFHAWSFDNEGNLKAAGNAENVQGFRLEDYGLSEIQVEEFANMVFVNLDPKAASLKSLAGDLEQDLRAKIPNFDRLKFARQDPYTFAFNWKFVLDQNECYHCMVVHPGVMAGSGAYLEPSFEVTEHKYWTAVVARSNEKERSPYGGGKNDEVAGVYIWTLWPNLILLTHQGPSNLKIQRIWATGPETSAQTIDNLCVNDPPTDLDLKQFNYYRDRVLPEDVPCMEKQQRGMRSRGYTQGRLMVDKERSWKSEHAVHHFDKLVWETLNGPNY